jgi:hypothetical protein
VYLISGRYARPPARGEQLNIEWWLLVEKETARKGIPQYKLRAMLVERGVEQLQIDATTRTCCSLMTRGTMTTTTTTLTMTART